MKTWSDYRQKVSQKNGEAKRILDFSETMAQISGSVYARRDDLGWTQRKLAEACGLTQSAIARFESGVTIPRADTLVRILTPLGLYLRAVRTDDPEQGRETAMVVDTLSVALVTGKVACVSERGMVWSDKQVNKEVLVDG